MKFDLYRDNKNEWRWRIKASNGKIIGDSGEGYKNRQDAIDMIKEIVKITQIEG